MSCEHKLETKNPLAQVFYVYVEMTGQTLVQRLQDTDFTFSAYHPDSFKLRIEEVP